MTDHDPGDEQRQTLADVLSEIGDRFDRQLAAEFEAAQSTVDRWRRGTVKPHPMLAILVIKRALYLWRNRP